MNFVIVDYSKRHLNKPTVYPHPTQWSGKFVRIMDREIEYLLFAPKEYASFHADILREFCADNEIPGVYIDSDKRWEIHDPDWTISGGGKFDIDIENKSLRLYDNSLAYGRFDSAGLMEKVSGSADFPWYSIVIE